MFELEQQFATMKRIMSGFAFMIGLIVALWLVKTIDGLIPVNDSWTPTSVTIVGEDVWISGTLIKHRNCQYIAPNRAKSDGGVNFKVESHSPTAGVAWIASDEPQRFGPWQVHGAANTKFTLYQEFECHAAWNVFNILGVVDARKKKI